MVRGIREVGFFSLNRRALGALKGLKKKKTKQETAFFLMPMDKNLLQKHFKGRKHGALLSLLIAETNKHSSESVRP